MSFKARISTEHLDIVEQLIDIVRKARSDEQITTEEADEIQHALEALVYPSAMELDGTVGDVVTALRRGFDAPSLVRRQRERRKDHGLRVLKGGKPEGPRAA